MGVDRLFDDDSGDDEDGSAGCLLCVALVLSLVISGCFTLQEARYWILGRTAVATVTHVNLPRPTDESDGFFEIRYWFIDSSSELSREEADSVPAAWGPPPQKLDVQYLPGRPSNSRIAGNRSNVAVWIFAITCLCVAAGFTYLYIDATRALAPHHSRSGTTRSRRRRRWFPKLG